MRSMELAFRYTFFVFLVLVSFCLLSVLWPVSATRTVHADSSTDLFSGADSPNAVTRSAVTTFSWINTGMNSVQRTVYKTPAAVGTIVDRRGKFVADGSKLVIRSVSSSAAMVGRGVSNGVGFIMRTPGNAAHFVTHFSAINIIRPPTNMPVPVINVPATGAPVANTNAVAAATITPPDEVPTWPMHGKITTQFGVPEPPYQPIHTGIDISDGQRAGTTPIHPFRSGRVIEVVHSWLQLGNHVVVDHGNGLTSVYGHLASTAVSEGQDVSPSTVLGFEGSTGVSTGTHLHFEIRQNNRPVNPMLYISGQP